MAAKTKTPEAPPADDSKASKRPALDLSLIASPYAVAAVEAERTAPRHARTEQQAAMDLVTEAVHQRWIEAERPSAWLKMPKAKYPVPPEQAEAWRRLVTNSASFLGYRARMGAAGSLCTGLDLENQGTEKYNPCGECLKIEAGMVAANDAEDGPHLSPEDLAEQIKAATGGHELVVFAILDKRPNKNRDGATSNGEAATDGAGSDENKGDEN